MDNITRVKYLNFVHQTSGTTSPWLQSLNTSSQTLHTSHFRHTSHKNRHTSQIWHKSDILHTSRTDDAAQKVQQLSNPRHNLFADETTNNIHQPSRKLGLVIIVSRKRSGSSFVGELLNQNPDVFYLFEPLQWLTFMGLRMKMQKAMFDSFSFNILNATSHCDFNNLPNGWLHYGKKLQCRFSKSMWPTQLCSILPKANSSLERMALARKTLANLTETCKMYRYIGMKTIRLADISILKHLITASTVEFDVKIIHLVRDPRATMNSRMNLKDPNVDFLRKRGKTGDEVTDLCSTMLANLAHVNNRSADVDWLNNRYKLVRYEDIAENPHAVANDVYKFLRMPVHKAVSDWIETNTKFAAGNEYSHTRDSKSTVQAWRESMDLADVLHIQKKCRKTMRLLGYQEVNSLDTLRNPFTPVIESLPFSTISQL